MSNKKKKEPNKIKLYYQSHKDLPAFKSLIKLFLYFLFFAIIIGVVVTHQDESNEEDKNTQDKTQEVTTKKISYKEVLDLLNNTDIDISYNITIGEILYKIEAEKVDEVYTGIIESTEGITKFKIQDNKVYEVKMNEDIINDNLFNNINLDYILINNLTNILLNNKSIKILKDDNTIYKYNIDNCEYNITIKDNWVDKIEISNDSSSYIIEYKKK